MISDRQTWKICRNIGTLAHHDVTGEEGYMRIGRMFMICLVIVTLSHLTVPGFGDVSDAAPATRQARLDSLSLVFEQRLEARRPALYYDLLRSDNAQQQRLNADPGIQIMYINERGHPVAYMLENLNAARTISTDDVWPGGSGGLSLSGSGTVLGQLAIWDGGGVLTTHQELSGRVTQMDSPGGTHYHSTHVAGTMIGAGVDASAKGMSFQGTLAAYDWNSDDSEMASAAAAGMNVSNHSYGYATGWYYSSDWYWWGDITVSTVEDYGFGFYSSEAEAWDQIAYDAPYYTIVKSAGNDRNDYGPGPGGGHYVWDGDWVWSTDTRDPDGGSDGYDCVSWNGTAKNILTVGAVYDIPGGHTDSSDVVMSSFSGWGPTDDGRLKPDLVANGISLYSCTNSGNSDYASYSGTSMSSPNLSGSLNLLVRHYEATHGGATPLSSTMKAVLIQTADEAGPYPGPDYMFGWGLMNTLEAAQLIEADSSAEGHIVEDALADGESDEYYISSDGIEPIRISLAWTDPPGTPPPASLNPTTLMLVNDLDVRLEHVATSTVYQPYVLNPSSPANAATTGDNWRDNSEQIYLESPSSGSYLVTVTHEGTLASAQTYSIVSSAPLGTQGPQAPEVTVTSPNGGETWDVGSGHDITWIATDDIGVTSIDILLSTDAGATFPTTIATGEANDGTYPWPVPASVTTQARVKVIAYDADTNSGEDVSNANFTIADGTDPQVTVTSPNGGEIWDIGTTYDVTWTASDNIGVVSVSIILSVDAGVTYLDTLATGEPNDGVYPWDITQAATTTARIKVVAYDGAGNNGEDISDDDFEIYDPAAGIAITKDIPANTLITGNSPNPFMQTTQVGFGIPSDGRVTLTVYDVGGRAVDVLLDQSMPAGYHSVTWRGGTSLGMGLYFVRLRFGTEEVTHKVVLTR
jgi:hypothetical protein